MDSYLQRAFCSYSKSNYKLYAAWPHFAIPRTNGLERFRWFFTFKISNYPILRNIITWEDKLHDKMISAYSKSCGYKKFSVHTNKKKYRFQIVPLWRVFSKRSVFVDLFMRISVDWSRIRNTKVAFFKFIRHSVDGASVWIYQCATLNLLYLACRAGPASFENDAFFT